jgi:hypothetical protein
MRNADGREPLFHNVDFIPANPEIGTVRADPRDPVALMPESRDRSIVSAFDPKTNTLVIRAYHIDKDRLNAEFKAARERRWRVEHIVLFISQDAWIDDMHFFLRNRFERREALETNTGRIALVKDIVPPKLVERVSIGEWKSPFLNIIPVIQAEVVPEVRSPEPAKPKESPKTEPKPALAKPLTIDEIERQAVGLDQEIAAELAKRANDRTPTAMLQRLREK